MEKSLGFCPVLSDLYFSKRSEGITGRKGKVFKELGALSTVKNLLTLRALAMERKPLRSLEVGLCFGGSCLTLASCHKDLGSAPSRQHIALDPFQSTVWDSIAYDLLEKARLSEYVEVCEEFSSLALPGFFREKRKFDFIYVDGSHLFEDVFVDFYFGVLVLAQGGLIVFDDSTMPDVKKVMGFIDANFGGSLRRLDLSPYRGDEGVARYKYKAAAALGRVQLTAYELVGKVPRPWDAPFKNF